MNKITNLAIILALQKQVTYRCAFLTLNKIKYLLRNLFIYSNQRLYDKTRNKATNCCCWGNFALFSTVVLDISTIT